MSSLEGYGKHLFKGAVAAPYLAKQGLSPTILNNADWTKNNDKHKVAAAVLDWARDNGAMVFCHWFQPLASAGFRHGQTAMVQNSMFKFAEDGTPVWDFDGDDLLKGETDGSSYPNGGLRATHTAGAYLSIDTSSPIFLRGDAIFVPASFISFYGNPLDEKTPLIRSTDAMSNQGCRLLNLLGYNVKSLMCNIGLEQELFLVPRSEYKKRLDLQMSGRTIMGKFPPRGQELCDHYMGPLSFSTAALEAMKEIQETCFKMGIPLKTRHREVAPGQFEFAPLYGTVTTQIDQNLVAMQVCEEIAAKHGLACLFQEKPFDGINGSGKHNNWSIGTADGTNLLNYAQLAKRSGSTEVFPVVMAAILKGINDYGDLMRMAIASPGNDFRLGACEAPPAIISTYLGEQMTNYLESYMNGSSEAYNPLKKIIEPGCTPVPSFSAPAEDRNRTSPFPYGGHRFEFRAVGSSQNVSLVNTVLAALCAASFREFADKIEAGQSPKAVAQAALKDSWKNIFNGNGYDPANQDKLTKDGLWRFDSGIDSICRYTEPKNIALFESLGILTKEDCHARQETMLNLYIGQVEIEAKCMIDMINHHVIPACKAGSVGPLSALEKGTATIREALHTIENTEDTVKKAHLSRDLRLETMISIRKHCDDAESVVPANLWTLATYKDLLFLDAM